MTRLEELTLELADETLTTEGALELATLLAGSESARHKHIQLLDLEAGLRATRADLDLAASIMTQLRNSLAESIARGVMSEIKRQPSPEWMSSRRKAEGNEPRFGATERADAAVSLRALSALRRIATSVRNRWGNKLLWAALAGCGMLLAGLGIWWLSPAVGEPVLAELQQTGLSLERSGQVVPAPTGMRLQFGDVLRTMEKASATIAFGLEKTRVTIQPDTTLQLGTWTRGKRFALAAGKLEASVARQRPFRPMTIITPQAKARILGTQFGLIVSTNATRLEVTEGTVQFTRLSDGEQVKVAKGQYAVASTNYELASLPLTGSILREYWTNISGTGNFTRLLRSPDYPDHPSGRSYLKRFEAPSQWGQNYGARITGYLHPPLTGEYTFWIESSDLCELFLSPSEDPEKRRQIAYAEATSPREWTKNQAQQTSAITLIAGRRYYIEVLQKQGLGDDHLAVAWQGPRREREIIPGEFLSPSEPKKEKARKP